jgi:hypothetical protein
LSGQDRTIAIRNETINQVFVSSYNPILVLNRSRITISFASFTNDNQRDHTSIYTPSVSMLKAHNFFLNFLQRTRRGRGQVPLIRVTSQNCPPLVLINRVQLNSAAVHVRKSRKTRRAATVIVTFSLACMLHARREEKDSYHA